MKRILLLAALMTIFIPTVAYSQENAASSAQKQNAARTKEMQLREKELDLQQKEAELKFQQQKRELELQSRKIELENARKPKQDAKDLILILILVMNVLCSIWVYQDIQKKSHESGIWIVVALLTGLIGTLVYAVIRIGDVTKQKA
jgi:Flp pilus assembly protein TadB